MAANSGYPALYVGQRFTASLAQSMEPVAAWKTASLTRASNASRTADPDLVLSVEANAVYTGKFMFVWTCTSTTPGTNFAFAVPSGSTGWYSYSGGQTTSDTNITFAIASGGGPATVVGTFACHGQFYLDTAGTAGTITLNWAQLVSNAAGVTLEAGSFLEMKRQE